MSIHVCFLMHLTYELKFSNGTFQIVNHLTTSTISFKITFYTICKNNYHFQALFFLFVYFFTLIIKNKSNIQQNNPIFNTCRKAIFPKSDTTQVGNMDPLMVVLTTAAPCLYKDLHTNGYKNETWIKFDNCSNPMPVYQSNLKIV